MKKIGILLIALMIISVEVITGCTQQSGNNNENTQKPNKTEEKYSEFVNWSINTSQMMEAQLRVIQHYWDNESWDDCLPYVSWVKSKIDTYTDQAVFFDLNGTLDSARNEFIKWLNAYKEVYDEWEIALQNFVAGDNATGNIHAQKGQDLLKNTTIYADNYVRYISEWRNEG